MKIIGEIPHPECKITIFNWNGKFLVKFERGLLEQTYKIPELEITSEADIDFLTKEPFLDKVLLRFSEMEKDLYEVMRNF